MPSGEGTFLCGAARGRMRTRRTSRYRAGKGAPYSHSPGMQYELTTRGALFPLSDCSGSEDAYWELQYAFLSPS